MKNIFSLKLHQMCQKGRKFFWGPGPLVLAYYGMESYVALPSPPKYIVPFRPLSAGILKETLFRDGSM